MRHARADYNRIQDPAAPPPPLAHALEATRERLALAEQDPPIDPTIPREDLRIILAAFAAVAPGTRPIALEEPVFLLRATDITAPDTVRAWARLQYETRRVGETEIEQRNRREMARLAMQHAADMEEWQAKHGAKLADMPPGPIVAREPAPTSGDPSIDRGQRTYIIAERHAHAEMISRHLGIERGRWVLVRHDETLAGLRSNVRVVVADRRDGNTPAMERAEKIALAQGLSVEHVSLDSVRA